MPPGTEPAHAARQFAGVRVCALVGLAFSAVAAVDYYGGRSTFCAEGGGCDAVRASEIGQSLGQALPALGVLGFASILGGTLLRAASLQLAALSAAMTSGVAGSVLLALQAFALNVFCPICVGADLAGVFAGLLAFPLLRRSAALPVPTPPPRMRGAWLASLVIAAGAPPAWAATQATKAPGYVASLGRAGKINVVEFSDFECPHCRAMHAVLMRALEPYRERVRFVRRVYPLPSHPNARAAARAYLCADAVGHGEAMADRLFTATDLSADACIEHAEALGLDVERFRRCTRDVAIERRLARDIEAIQRSGLRGVPTVWIGDEAIEGFDHEAGAAPYVAALERAAGTRNRARDALPWLAVATCALAAFWLGSLRRLAS